MEEATQGDEAMSEEQNGEGHGTETKKRTRKASEYMVVGHVGQFAEDGPPAIRLGPFGSPEAAADAVASEAERLNASIAFETVRVCDRGVAVPQVSAKITRDKGFRRSR